MISNNELNQLITKARAKGAFVEVQHDIDALLDEGREVIESVRVEGGWTTHDRTRTEMQEREANARLIAASPELYEALEHCENLLMRYEINRVDGGAIADEALTKIRAALAKARGES